MIEKNSISELISFIKELYVPKYISDREKKIEGIFVPLHEPNFPGNEKKYLLETIDSTFVSSVGAFVDRFEKDMSSIAHTKRSVALVNGTSALQISLILAGVKPDNEVLTQALTFVATANSIAYTGANPVFIDVDRDTMGLSPDSLERFLTNNAELRDDGCYNKVTKAKISACVPMHTFGFMCRIDKIIKICKEWKIPVIEDAAEALGSSYKGKPSGSFGLLSAFSLNGNKIVTSGGGGAITTDNESIADQAKHLTTTAKIPHKWEYFHDRIGYNYRMPNLNAALACAQLEKLNLIKNSKRDVYNQYQSFLVNKGINLVNVPEDTEWNYWLMSILLDDKNDRDLFLTETNQNGVMTRPIWQLMYRLPEFKDCQKDNQKNAEFLEQRIVNIPSSAIL